MRGLEFLHGSGARFPTLNRFGNKAYEEAFEMVPEKDFGDIGEAQLNFHRMSQGMVRLREIMEEVEDDDLIS